MDRWHHQLTLVLDLQSHTNQQLAFTLSPRSRTIPIRVASTCETDGPRILCQQSVGSTQARDPVLYDPLESLYYELD